MPDRPPAPGGPSGVRLLLPFAGAYFLSYLFRTVNAVVGPVLVQELGLGAAGIGLLTSAYFLAFGLVQLPLGVLLDRHGPRRVEGALLVVAAAGTLLFATSAGVAGLTAGRALIGLGASAGLMGALKAFSQFFPAERQASLAGWILAAGGLGALASTAPLEAALRHTGWREIFLGLAAATAAAAAWIWFGVPDAPRAAPAGARPAADPGLAGIFRSRAFWRVAPLGLLFTGGFMAVQGLWSASFLMAVNGLGRAEAAGHLAALSGAMLVAYAAIGAASVPLARRGIGTAALLGGGVGGSLLALLAIVAGASDRTRLLWVAHGALASFGTLIYPLAAQGFGPGMTGRVNTALNLLVFAGAFALQWGMGAAIDALRGAGQSAAAAHRLTFAALLAAQALAWAWFVLAGRRARPPEAA